MILSQDAKRLIRILRGIPSKINLIPLNEAPGIPLKRPSDEKVKRFQEILMEGGLTAIVRTSKGGRFQLPAANSKRKNRFNNLRGLKKSIHPTVMINFPNFWTEEHVGH